MTTINPNPTKAATGRTPQAQALFDALLDRAEAGDDDAAMEVVLTRAYEGSLLFTEFYVAMTGGNNDDLDVLYTEQIALTEQITRAGLIPFDGSDTLDARMTWLDANAGKLADRSPLLARYAEIGAKRLAYLPDRN